MAVTIHGCNFAETDGEYQKAPRKYRGFVKRFSRRLEFFDKNKTPVAAINKHGVIFELRIRNGKKDFGFAWRDSAAFALFKNPGVSALSIHDDLKKIAVSHTKKTIDTRKDGGMFSAYPDYEYWFK